MPSTPMARHQDCAHSARMRKKTSHFILTCPALSTVRNHKLDQIYQLYRNKDVRAPDSNEELLSAILNGSYFQVCSSNNSEMDDTQINHNTETQSTDHVYIMLMEHRRGGPTG